jgi:hypothetical protein
MRKFLLLVSVLALLVPGLLFPGTPAAHAAPPVPYEEARFARVAAELAKDPLYVDMDMADAIDGSMRTALRGVMTRTSQALGVPVYFVAIPNDDDAESYSKNGAFLAGLNAHVRRDGLYLMTDADGDIGYAAYGVPRELRSADRLSISVLSANDSDQPFIDLVPRATRAMDHIANATPGPPSTETYDTGVPPIGQENPPLEAEFWGPFTGGLFLAGPFAALALYGLFLLGLRPWRSKKRPAGKGATKKRPAGSASRSRGSGGAPSRPSLRWVRSHAEKEMEALSSELDPDRPGMLRAYDAARILHDDVESRSVKNDDAAFLDLVGVLVLARQGRAARDRTRPVPTCFVNPLHGDAGRSRRKIRDQGRQPVCDGCATGDVDGRYLCVPDGRRHYTVPGRWQRGAFGARRPDLPADVLESLGVHD